MVTLFGQPIESGHGEQPTEPPSLEVRVHRDHVDLAQHRRAICVHLGPTRRGQLAVLLAEDEALGIEPVGALAGHKVARSQWPCSGWAAKARLFTSSHRSSSAPIRNDRKVMPSSTTWRSETIGSGTRIWSRSRSSAKPERPRHLVAAGVLGVPIADVGRAATPRDVDRRDEQSDARGLRERRAPGWSTISTFQAPLARPEMGIALDRAPRSLDQPDELAILPLPGEQARFGQRRMPGGAAGEFEEVLDLVTALASPGSSVVSSAAVFSVATPGTLRGPGTRGGRPLPTDSLRRPWRHAPATRGHLGNGPTPSRPDWPSSTPGAPGSSARFASPRPSSCWSRRSCPPRAPTSG